MKGPLPAWDKNVHYVMSKDFFTTAHEKLASCGNQFDILNNKVSRPLFALQACKHVLQSSVCCSISTYSVVLAAEAASLKSCW